MLNTKKSAYLSEPKRLAEVIAAIQAMGKYKFYKLAINEWSKRISGDDSDTDHWRKIFLEHPEFFRLNSSQDKASLVLRRNYQRAFHVDRNEELSRVERDCLPEDELSTRVSRLPLTNNDIAVLVQTAIDLHSRALEKEKAASA